MNLCVPSIYILVILSMYMVHLTENANSEILVGALSNILVFLGEEREWLRVDREGENEPR